MKFTYHWLREYCDSSLRAEELAERLTMSGLEVEEIVQLQSDACLQVEVTTNRPDLLGVIGIAREVAALTGARVKIPSVEHETGGSKAEDLTAVEVRDPDLCPRYTARMITGVKIRPSPAWLQERLEGIGLRPVNNVVDVTNFVLMECGQPLHAFDFDKLEGGRIVVRRAEAAEPITAIDGTEHNLTSEMLVIADAARPVAVAGVMGGLDSEVSDGTTNILLESAQFEPTQVRRTSRALALASDSSYRFERGVDPEGVDWASRRAAALIREVAGGEIASGVIDVRAAPFEPKRIQLRIARMAKVLGMKIAAEEAARILEGLGLGLVSRSSDLLEVTAPSWRGDLYREIDLVEEVARIYGYDKIPCATGLRIAAGQKSKYERVVQDVQRMLVGAGFSEAVTSSFHDEAAARLVSPWTKAKALTFRNPVRSYENRLRRSLMPGLLTVKQTNTAHGNPRADVFEISKVYLPRQGEKLPEERNCLALLTDGDLLHLKGTIEALLQPFGIAARVKAGSHTGIFFPAGRSAEWRVRHRLLAVMGQVSRNVAEVLDLRTQPCLAELDLDLLVEHAVLDKRFKHLPAYPGITRDIAIAVDESVTWAVIESFVRGVGIDTLDDVRFFDLYRGKQVPEGKKSVAFSLHFRSPDRTLRHEEADEAEKQIVAALQSQLRAERR